MGGVMVANGCLDLQRYCPGDIRGFKFLGHRTGLCCSCKGTSPVHRARDPHGLRNLLIQKALFRETEARPERC